MKALSFILVFFLFNSCNEDPAPAEVDPLQVLEGRYDYFPYYMNKDFTPHTGLNSMQDVTGSFEFERSTTPGTFNLHTNQRGTVVCQSLSPVADGYIFTIPSQTNSNQQTFTGVANIDLNGAKHEGRIILSEKRIQLLVEVGNGTERVILAINGKRRE
jgi:hypothetical protein